MFKEQTPGVMPDRQCVAAPESGTPANLTGEKPLFRLRRILDLMDGDLAVMCGKLRQYRIGFRYRLRMVAILSDFSEIQKIVSEMEQQISGNAVEQPLTGDEKPAPPAGALAIDLVGLPDILAAIPDPDLVAIGEMVLAAVTARLSWQPIPSDGGYQSEAVVEPIDQ